MCHPVLYSLLLTHLSGTGSVSAPIARAAGREPVVCGKPSAHVFECVRRLHPDVRADRTIMIGDRLVQ